MLCVHLFYWQVVMKTFEFSGNALVESQGPRVLSLLARQADHAEYEVIGFHGTVTIRDYRPESLAALDAFANGSQTVDFAEEFSQPALVQFVVDGNDIAIELRDPLPATPEYMLWIAVGLTDELPVLDYVVAKFETLEDEGLAVVALTRLAGGGVDAPVETPLFSAYAL